MNFHIARPRVQRCVACPCINFACLNSPDANWSLALVSISQWLIESTNDFNTNDDSRVLSRSSSSSASNLLLSNFLGT